VGTREAYRALATATTAALGKGRLPTQHVSALTSFSGRPFFEADRVVRLLSRAAADRRLSWVTRKRAVLELGRLEGSAGHLRRLREVYGRDKLGETDSYVAKAIERLLTRKER
jgi:hypothetical protein